MNHELTNIRPIPGHIPTCARCHRPLHEVELSSLVTPRRGHPTFCSQQCWSDHAWSNVGTDPGWDERVNGAGQAPRPFAKPVEARKPLERGPKTIAEINDNKTVLRQTGEAAANVVGFIIWLLVVSAIAAGIFALTGIATL